MECRSRSHRRFTRHCHYPSLGYGWCLCMHGEVYRPSVWQCLQLQYSQWSKTVLILPAFKGYTEYPTTQAALLKHTLRAVRQGGHVWGQALVPSPNLHDPSLWGWQRQDGGWTPLWTLLPQDVDTCSELTRCNCRKAYRRSCKCVTAGIECSAFCFCAGRCFND